MSNLIKWNYINLERDNRRVIDSDHSRKNPFPEQSASGISLNNEEKNRDSYDEILKKEREQIELEKKVILSQARKQADELISQARTVAENIKNEGYENGYESGISAGKAEVREILEKEKAKLSSQKEALEAAYEKQLQDMEPRIADFMTKLVEKLTGVVIEDKGDIILHLVRTGLNETGKSTQFTIRVSPEDFPIVEAQKEKLLMLTDGQGEMLFREDKGLTKNQCVIETDTAIVESSLDIQLKNLMEDIRLMALRVN